MSAEEAQAPPSGSELTDELFVIEQRGIDLVGPEARHGKPVDLFWMWMGSNLNVFYPVNGALVIYFGLSFSQSILVILLGNLIFVGVGLTSLQGPKTGTSTFAISRAAYGQNGGSGLSLFNWVTCVGFEASGLALIVLAGLALFGEAGIHPTTGLKIVLLLVAMVLQAFLPVLGHQTIVTVQRYLAYLLIPLFVVMAVVVSRRVHISSLSHGASWATVMVAIALVVSAGGLSWANTGSDYSRYLPADADQRAVFLWPSLGGMIPAVLLEILGAAIASIVSTASDPVSGLPKALPGWVVTPYLFVAIITLFAVNTIDLYSSGLTLQAIGLRLKRWQCVIVDMIIATFVGGVTIFNSDFNRLYSEFLSLLIVWLSPWLAIYVIDWALRKGKYDPAALLQSRGGRYWRQNGFNIPGVVAQLAGMAASCLWIDSTAFVGPLSSRTSGSDFSFFTGLLVGGLVYFLLGRRAVKADVAPSPAVIEGGLGGAPGTGEHIRNSGLQGTNSFDVPRYLFDQLILAPETALLSHERPDFHADRLAVDVPVKVKEVRLDEPLAGLVVVRATTHGDGRRMTGAVLELHDACIDTVGEIHVRTDPQVGCRGAERAAAMVAPHNDPLYVRGHFPEPNLPRLRTTLKRRARAASSGTYSPRDLCDCFEVSRKSRRPSRRGNRHYQGTLLRQRQRGRRALPGR